MKKKNINIKETGKHALWSCFSLGNLYKDFAEELNIDCHINFPITAKNVIIWDEGKTSIIPINILNAIGTITINEILRSKESKNIPNVKNITRKIKGEIITITKDYPNKIIARDIGKLHLTQFLASHEIAS